MRIGGIGWQVFVLAAAAGLLVPWTVLLGVTLPPVAQAEHWSLAWTGLDALIAVGLAGTAWLAHQRDIRVVLPATATATLMVFDAWFDLCTAAPGPDFSLALVEAALCELPLAAVCAGVALSALRRLTRTAVAVPR
ncbi:hypothetical protein GCM10010174_26400 [Kutzneria viridogrisea]|uniref:Uncharacterized protein n=1 Tax=Kutzneria viridogrisea TaxID=47990 RepID=A0ABR6BRM0_9PSEU|nr:hypothetical protein [Kutzneria viridogrisea]